MSTITNNIIKTAVKADEYAVAEYVKQVCEQMSEAGVDLSEYNLVRTVDNRDLTDMKVIYSIEKKVETE